MAKDTGFRDYILEQLEGVEGITSRSMFGGHALYKGGYIFGMILDGKLYFKVDELSVKDYKDHGMQPFTYTHKSGKTVTMPYYEVSEEIIEDRHDLKNWLQKALFASMREKRKGTKERKESEETKEPPSLRFRRGRGR